VAKVLADSGFSGLPVVADDGMVAGVVSETDILSKQGRTASDIMTRGVISVTPDTEVDAVRDLLINRHIRRVPVMDGPRLVGIISRRDIVRQLARQWVCEVCGELTRDISAPSACARCGRPALTAADSVPSGDM
jgi:CBS domain-containing protein